MILIVEDDEGLTRLLSMTFNKMNWHSHVAQNGVDAYRMVRQKAMKCVLLDIRMPMIDGMEFLSLMKKDGINVPTIIMTGDADFDMHKLHAFPNVVGFMAKPFTMPEIVEMIQQHIGHTLPAASEPPRFARDTTPPHLAERPKPLRRTWRK